MVTRRINQIGPSGRAVNAGGLRITGGKWRGKKVVCPPGGRMRPTGDLNRQRLFNWLGEEIVGASVLDLYAGSGVLSLEALSRGAAEAVLVELDREVVSYLYTHHKTFNIGDNLSVITAKLPQRLNRVPIKNYDLIMIDPPFQFNLAIPTCQALVANNYLAPQTKIYLECEKRLDISPLLQASSVKNNDDEAPSWQLIQSAVSGEVAQYLLCYQVSDRLGE